MKTNKENFLSILSSTKPEDLTKLIMQNSKNKSPKVILKLESTAK